jgi:hypothetical protein
MPIECSFGAGRTPRSVHWNRDAQGSFLGVFEQPSGRGWLRGATLAAAILALAEPVSAESKVGVDLEIRECPFLDAKEVRRVVHAELRVEPTPEPALDPTQVLAVCGGDRLQIQVVDPISRKLLRRNFALRDRAHPGLSRLVGIAAAELVLASWAELAFNPDPEVEPEGPAPQPELVRTARTLAEARPARARERAEARRASRSARPARVETPPLAPLVPEEPELDLGRIPEDTPQLRILALASRRSFFTHDGALWGGGARVGAEPLPHTSWSVDMLFEAGEFSRTEGNFTVDTWTVGAQLYLFQRLNVVTLRLGGGLRAGLIASSPEGGGGGTRTVAPWGWPLLAASLSVQMPKSFAIELSSEASYVSLPLSSGSNAYTVRGTWFSAQFGLGYVL